MFDDIFQKLKQETVPDKSIDAAPVESSESSAEGIDQRWHPTDLSPQIELWLSQVAQLAETYHIQSITAAIETLHEHWLLPGFRLAFVGEFNRGKSTLINRLLDRALVPIGVLPTTANIISVIAGEEDHLAVQYHDGRQEVRPLTAASWNDLIAGGTAEKDERTAPSIRVVVKHPWLRDSGIEMIDTPGAGDVNDARTTHIFQVLSQCDAAVVLISAVVPLSLTERAFIEQEILGRHIPLVLVVVSMLDTIAIDQRATVMAAIRQRLDQISPEIPLLASHEATSASATDPLEEIRKQIAIMAEKSDRQAWRSRQVAGKLTDYLHQLVVIGQETLAQEAMDQTQRAQAHKKAQAVLLAEASHWETIKLEFYQRRLQVEQELSQKLRIAGDHLVQFLNTELVEYTDPRVWWEQQFPFLLHRELLLLARSSSSFVLEALAHDVEHLRADFAKTFDMRFDRSTSTFEIDIANIEPQADVPTIELADTEQQLFLSRIGSSAAVLIGYLLVGPIGSAISAAVVLASERILKQAVDVQRQQIRGEIVGVVDRTLQEYTSIFRQRLRGLYEEVAQDIGQEQQTWLMARREMLKLADETPKKRIAWTEMIEDANNIRTSIIADL